MQVVAPIGAALVIGPWFTRLPNEPVAVSRRAGPTATGLLRSGSDDHRPLAAQERRLHGNPVYPLGYSIFGGIDWNPALDAKFRLRPQPAPRERFFNTSSMWSPITTGRARCGMDSLRWRCLSGRGGVVFGLWVFACICFTWWAFTHQIDRFWVPMIPVVCLLAGIGARAANGMRLRWGCNVCGAARRFNFAFIAGNETAYLHGYNAFLGDLDRAKIVSSPTCVI